MTKFEKIEKKVLEATVISKITIDEIVVFIENNKHLFGLQTISAEDLQDLYVLIYPQMQKMIKSFDCTKGTFFTYLYNFINLNLKHLFYKKNSYNSNEECTALINIGSYENKEYLYSQQEYEQKIDENKPIIYDMVDFFCNFFDEDELINFQQAIVVIALKYSFYIDRDFFVYISVKFSLNQNKLFEFYNLCLQSIEKKITRRDKLEKSINSNYFRIVYYKCQLNKQSDNPFLFKDYTDKIAKLEQSLHRKIAKLETHKDLILVSNTTLSSLLEIAPEKINSICKKFFNNMDIIIESGYISDYENLFSNRKSQQEKRDAGTFSRAYNCYSKGRKYSFRSGRNRINLLRK